MLVTPRQADNLRREVQPWPDVSAFVAEPTVMNTLAGFPIHRGCLALARCPLLNPSELWALVFEASARPDQRPQLCRLTGQ